MCTQTALVTLFSNLSTPPIHTLHNTLQGYIPRGIDKSYVSGFLAREIERAAARALEASSTSSSSSRVPGAALLLSVVSKYGQLMGVDHLALAVHKLAELRQQEAAGADQVCCVQWQYLLLLLLLFSLLKQTAGPAANLQHSSSCMMSSLEQPTYSATKSDKARML